MPAWGRTSSPVAEELATVSAIEGATNDGAFCGPQAVNMHDATSSNMIVRRDKVIPPDK
jgi:hypothetical protein